MKQFQLSAFFLISTIVLHAQVTDGKTNLQDFTPGSVVTIDNITLAGHIKNNMKQNGGIIFLSSDGKKTRYTASQLSAVIIDSINYLVANNAFYKVVMDGTKIKLLRKASNSSRIEYNGSEPIAVNAGEGAYDDYFIQTVATKKLQRVPKKDFQKILSAACADCTTLTEDLKANKVGYHQIEQAVAFYNTCSK